MEIFKKRVPEVDVEVMTPNMLMGLGLMKTDRYAKNGIGWIDEKKMCNSVDLVNTYMGLPKKVECKDVYSTEFFTKVADAEELIARHRSRRRDQQADRPRPGRHDLRGGERPGRGPRRHLAVGRRRRVRLAGRPERLRQVDPAAHRGRAAARHGRHDHGRRPRR